MDTHSSHPTGSKNTHLGDFVISTNSPLDQKKIISLCAESSFKEKTFHKKLHTLFSAIASEILAISQPVFLLPSLIKLFEAIEKQAHLSQVSIAVFEHWLNQHADLSADENYKIRAKICGKYIPRDHYQIYFPIGQNKTYFGSHFVTAHSSPDLDTTVASFWGWMDAFAARVSEGLHHWNVPGGAPSYQVEFKLIFDDIFGSYLFPFCAKHRGALQVSSFELLTQKGVLKCSIDESSFAIDTEKNSQAVLLVDDKGYFNGDWRTIDVEGVRQVVMLVNQTLRHFQNHFQKELIALFSKDDLKKTDLHKFIENILNQDLASAESLKDLSDRQRKHISDYLIEVLHINEGLDANIKQLSKGFASRGVSAFGDFIEKIQGKTIDALFDKQGHLIASRSALFATLDEIIASLSHSIHAARQFVDKLRVALEIKSKVFGYKPQYVTDKADVEELRTRMGNSSYLTVVYNDHNGMLPLGVIYASDLYRSTLGTVTLRDFSNRDETKVPSYLEVISVVDHHKSQLSSLAPSTIYISDAQSSNTKVAELAFAVNDRTSTAGMSRESILKQLSMMRLETASNSQKRIYRKLLQKLEALDKRGSYFIDPVREYVEYYHFLFAILDDTDLLSKVSYQDVEIVKELINRMKTLILKEETEVVHFDDISEGPEFVHAAASRLLRNADLYSITQKIYKNKEKFIDEIIEKAAREKDVLFFADTKEQNGCVRVGQFKLYPINYSCYKSHQKELQNAFIDESRKVSVRKKDIDLHIFMVSTLQGLEGLFDGRAKETAAHNDEIWIYVPEDSETGLSHLRTFFNSFGAANATQKALKKARLIGSNEALSDLLESTLLTQSKIPFEVEPSHNGASFIVLDVAAGSMNSRKAMISPYLPKLIV